MIGSASPVLLSLRNQDLRECNGHKEFLSKRPFKSALAQKLPKGSWVFDGKSRIFGPWGQHVHFWVSDHLWPSAHLCNKRIPVQEFWLCHQKLTTALMVENWCIPTSERADAKICNIGPCVTNVPAIIGSLCVDWTFPMKEHTLVHCVVCVDITTIP